MQLSLQLRNTSGGPILVWGQDFGGSNRFYLIQSFVKGRTNAVWEREEFGMCASVGRIGWIEVRPGETIHAGHVTLREYAGRQMLLTLRRAYSQGDSRGSEILLGPFTIPDPQAQTTQACPRGHQTRQVPMLPGIPSREMLASLRRGEALLAEDVGKPDHAAQVCDTCRQWKTETMSDWQPLPGDFGTDKKP